MFSKISNDAKENTTAMSVNSTSLKFCETTSTIIDFKFWSMRFCWNDIISMNFLILKEKLIEYCVLIWILKEISQNFWLIRFINEKNINIDIRLISSFILFSKKLTKFCMLIETLKEIFQNFRLFRRINE